MPIRPLLAIPLLLVVVAPGRAQEPEKKPPQSYTIPVDEEGGELFPLSLGEALRIGARNNTALRVEELLPMQSSQDVRGARAVFEPELFADATAARSESPSRIFQGAGFIAPSITNTSYNGRFGMRQLVPSGGLFDLAYSPTKIRQNISGPETEWGSDITVSYIQPLLRGGWADYTLSDVHTQEARRAGAELRYDRKRQDILYSIVEAYWNLVFARGDYVVAVQALELSQAQLERTNRKIEVGELAPLDRVADEAELARRREELVTARNEIFDRQDDLRRLLFDDTEGRIWVRHLEPTTELGEFPETVDLEWRAVARSAMRLRPDLRALRSDVAAAEVLQRAADNEVMPQLDLIGSFSSDGTDDTHPEAFSTAISGDFPAWSVQLQLSVPVGNNAALATRDRARLEWERTRRLLNSAEIDVSLEARDAVRRLKTLAETIQRGAESERLAETNLSREIARKEAGSSTTFEVQERNQELQEARSRLLRNRLDYRIAEANLRYVQGVLDAGVVDDSGPMGSGDDKG